MSQYWQKRFEMLEDARNKTAKRTVQAITPAFDQAQAQIEKEINAWYARFAKNNSITLQEAKKLLNTKELKEFKWDVEEYIKYGRENAIDQKWMKELENASARFHISRLEALKIRTQNAAEQAFGNELDQLDNMAARLYMNDYYHTAYEIQKGLGIGWDVGQIDQRKLDNILSKPWTTDNNTFKDRIWKQKTSMVSELHNQMTRMCILGKAPDEAIKEMEKFLDKDIKNKKAAAGRLVMTEAAYFGSVAQKDAFTDLDIERFEIVATLDSHTSEICQQMDGKVFDMKDFQAGVTAPPFHVWCRSCTCPWFEDNDDGTRAARGADGKTYQVPASMKYEDWKEYFVDKTKDPADWLKPATVEDVVEAVKKFTDKEVDDALEWYVSGEGQWVNRYLRNPEEWVDKYGISDDELKLIEAMKQGTDSEIVKESVLYRSVDASAVFGKMTNTEYENLQNALVYNSKDKFSMQAKTKFLDDIEGKEIIEKGFMSTTKDVDLALEWGDFTGSDKPIVLELKVPKGIHGKDLHEFEVEGDEQFEVLLSPNQKYKIKEVTSREGQIYVKADLIAEEPANIVKESKPKAKVKTNAKQRSKLSKQWKQTDAMNEYDYYTEDQEQFRKNAIMELTGYDEEAAQEALEALCGSRDKYLRLANSGGEYKFGWFYGEDFDIRNTVNAGAEARAKIIDKYIQNAPSYEGVVYRGLSLDDDSIESIKKNGKLKENGVLSSWTSDESVAEMFAQGRSEELGTTPVILRCKNVNDSTPVAHLSIYGSDENEVLVSNFNRKEFIVESVTEQDGVVIVDLVEG